MGLVKIAFTCIGSTFELTFECATHLYFRVCVLIRPSNVDFVHL